MQNWSSKWKNRRRYNWVSLVTLRTVARRPTAIVNIPNSNRELVFDARYPGQGPCFFLEETEKFLLRFVWKSSPIVAPRQKRYLHFLNQWCSDESVLAPISEHSWNFITVPWTDLSFGGRRFLTFYFRIEVPSECTFRVANRSINSINRESYVRELDETSNR